MSDLEDSHHHSHAHAEPPAKKKMNKDMKKLVIVACLCTVFMFLEFAGGYFADSIAIMSDAAHLLSDLSGFIISIASIYIA